MKKILIGLISSSALTFVGILLQLSARAIAWPKTYQYSGPRADTTWARQEDASGQVGLVLMCVGGLLFVVTYFHWLGLVLVCVGELLFVVTYFHWLFAKDKIEKDEPSA